MLAICFLARLLVAAAAGMQACVVTGKTLATSLGLLLIDPVMTSELHLDLFRTLGCRRAFFIGENPGVPNNYDLNWRK